MRSAPALSLLLLAILFLPGCPGPKKGGGSASGPAPVAEHPVGTGPWKFKSWQRDQKIILVRNETYWGEKPGAKSLWMVPIKENAQRRAQLEHGSAHVLDGIRPLDAKYLAKRKNVEILHQEGLAMAYLAMNTEREPFTNPKVRKAIALAIDKDKIIKANFQGYAKQAENAMPPGLLGYDESVKPGAPDIARAKALLKESGVTLPIKTELWHMPIPRPYMPEPRKIAILIKESLAKIGVEVELVSWPWSIYLSKTKKGEHPMCLLGWTADVADPDNFLYVLLSKDTINSTNVSRYADEEVTRILREAQSSLDEKQRAELYRQAQAKIREDAPIVPLVYADQLMAYRKSVKGFSLHRTGHKDFSQIQFSGKSLIFARGGDATKLDPALVDDGESVAVTFSVYENLVKYGRDNLKIEPSLAESWERSEDGLTWTFKLRKGVTFHDDTPFDAEAVVVNFQRIINKNDPLHDPAIQNRSLYEPIKSVAAADSHTVVFKLERPVAAFLGNLTIYTASIVSPTALRQAKGLTAPGKAGKGS